jgi:hypothetical protein
VAYPYVIQPFQLRLAVALVALTTGIAAVVGWCFASIRNGLAAFGFSLKLCRPVLTCEQTTKDGAREVTVPWPAKGSSMAIRTPGIDVMVWIR